MAKPKKQFVSLTRLIEETSLPKTYIAELTVKGIIPALNVNGRLRFNPEAVQKALDELAAKEGIMGRDAKIAKRRAQIPRAFKATYDRAIKGKSLRAAVNAQGQEENIRHN